MSRCHTFISLLLILCCLLAGTALADDEFILQADGYQIIMDQAHWDSFDHTHSAYQTPEAFLTYVKDCADEIASFVGRPDWLDQHAEKVLRISVPAGRSYSKRYARPTVFLESSWLSSDMAPVYHELTHLICPNITSRSLSEGFCNYVHMQLEGPPMVFTFGQNPHVVTQNLIRHNPRAADMMNDIGAIKPFSRYAESPLRGCFYTASHSFVDYLITTYGLEDFLQLYAATTNEAYQTLWGKPYEEIYGDWLAFLDANYASDYTLDDYIASVTETLISHHWPQEIAPQSAAEVSKLFAP